MLSGLELIVTSEGSSSHVPVLPIGAVVSTARAPRLSVAPEVSTSPPSPPCGPPRAAILPATVVTPPEITETVPPGPDWVAEASRLEAASMLTELAAKLPIAIVPPPLGPVALTVAPASVIEAAFSDAVPPAVAPETSMVPARLMLSLASSETTPPCETSELASMTPVLLMTPPKRLLAAWADISTRPSGAAIRLWFSISALTVAGSTAMPTRPWPLKSSVTVSPAASATVPSRAEITPWLITSGARSPM